MAAPTDTPLDAQTATPVDLLALPDKASLLAEYIGKPLAHVRTPAFVVDRACFARNCANMHKNARDWGARFRAHLKTHKTVEGTRMQLISSADRTDAVVVSTLMEAWQIVRGGLVADGTVKDILYGLPVALNKISDLSQLWDDITPYQATIRLLVDHPEQIRGLERFEMQRDGAKRRKWSIFLKVDGGQKRAGLEPHSSAFHSLLRQAMTCPVVAIYGFYCHAGNSYAATSQEEASTFLSSEVEAVDAAARVAIEMRNALTGSDQNGAEHFVLSVGSTPTAHVASAEARTRLKSLLHGTLELHAGNYPFLDLQQLHTGLIEPADIAQTVLSTVISYYPGRGQDGSDEAMCDAGGIAMSKDTGPSGGYGDVVGKSWKLGRLSQEHGILTFTGSTSDPPAQAGLTLGDRIHIVGQHACFIAAAYSWYYVVDSAGKGDEIVDVWVAWKGW